MIIENDPSLLESALKLLVLQQQVSPLLVTLLVFDQNLGVLCIESLYCLLVLLVLAFEIMKLSISSQNPAIELFKFA